jgi:hypothetical protein
VVIDSALPVDAAEIQVEVYDTSFSNKTTVRWVGRWCHSTGSWLTDTFCLQLLYSTFMETPFGPTSPEYRPVPPRYFHGLSYSNTVTFLGKAQWTFRFSPTEEFVSSNSSADGCGPFTTVFTLNFGCNRYAHLALCVCVFSKIVLAVGLVVTTLVSVAIPWMLLGWRQRQQEAAARAEARIAKETFSQTLGIVCHELRNPVHALKGLLVMIADDVRLAHLPGLLSELSTAQGCVGTMQSVLDDVLEMQRHDVVG